MKNRYYLSLAFLGLFTINGTSQTITATGSTPVAGEIINFVTTSYFAPGSSGTGQTWNFASLTGTPGTGTYSTASSTPYAASFPNANLAFVSGATYAYYNTSASAYQGYGSYTTSATMPYSNPEDILRFPFAHTNTYTDPFVATFVSGGYTFLREGSTTVTADGTGTITTPSGTYTNVLRVHFVQVYTDSTNIAGTPYIVTYNNDQYIWYKEGTHYAIAATYNLVSSAGTFTGGHYLVNTSLGVEENVLSLNQVNLFPNPASQMVNINYTLENSSEVKISIFNIAGQEVYTENIVEGFAGENFSEINVSSFVKGTYFVKIQSNESNVTKKLIVE